jgi:hypothetical protein
MLKLCLCVSQGIPLWDMPTMEGDVLYLCLEDTFCRIQDRLFLYSVNCFSNYYQVEFQDISS